MCLANEHRSQTQAAAKAQSSPPPRMVKSKAQIPSGDHRLFLVSADMGHGVHPNAIDKHDPINRPVLNAGPMIKIAANQNFTTDSDAAAVFEILCRGVGVPTRRFVSRSDLRGGGRPSASLRRLSWHCAPWTWATQHRPRIPSGNRAAFWITTICTKRSRRSMRLGYAVQKSSG